MTQGLIAVTWVALQSLLVSAMLLLLYRLRPWFGHSLLYLSLGSFQYLQTYLAVTASVSVAPGLVLNPGSAVLFTATLFVILLVYITEDLEETRRLIYGIVIANILVTLVSALFSIQMGPAAGADLAVTMGMDILDVARVLSVGTAILFLDVVITVLTYSWLRRVTRIRMLQVSGALALALLLDSLLFVTFNFYAAPEYLNILGSSVLGKWIAALCCAGLMSLYLRGHTDPEPVVVGFGSLFSVFRLLTYNAPIDELRARLKIDDLTGVYNRAFFDRQLERETGAVGESGKSVSLLMVDLDHFKSVNDNYGHQAGDQLLRMVGTALKEGTRITDYVCRYGGEEFSVILPAADKAVAAKVAEKLRQTINAVDTTKAGMDKPITTTIGLACFPDDAITPHQLVKIADRRLYEGKRRGRNCVIAEGV